MKLDDYRAWKSTGKMHMVVEQLPIGLGSRPMLLVHSTFSNKD